MHVSAQKTKAVSYESAISALTARREDLNLPANILM